MPDNNDYNKQVTLLKNWPLISHKKKILAGINRILQPYEQTRDIIEGFFQPDNGHYPPPGTAGIMIVTDKRMIFISHENKQLQTYQLTEINIITSEKLNNSIRIDFKINNSNAVFRTFFLINAVHKFIDLVKNSNNIRQDEEITQPLKDEDFFDFFPKMSGIADILDSIKGFFNRAPESSPQKGQYSVKNGNRLTDFLFMEAKKIYNALLPVMSTPRIEELVINDLVSIATLCVLADGGLNQEEAFFLSLVLLSFKKNRSIIDLLEQNVYTGNASELVAAYGSETARLISEQDPGSLRSPSLLSLAFIREYDKQFGTINHEVAKTAYNSFAHTVIKANGTISAKEKEVLERILYITSHNETINPGAVTAGKEPAPIKTEHNDETLENVMTEINGLTGMQKIKDEIKTLINLIKVQKERNDRGLPVTPLSLHAVFYGPPGTGKTTIARLLGRVYACLGLLDKGHIVETDRVGLVAGFVGQTAIKTDEIIQKSLDGILFIDEAYTLSLHNDGKDYGREAIDTILKRMEDYRDRLVVIVAGYPDEMKKFINSNPGLKSRFNRYFYFDHYKPQELLDIFMIFSNKAKFILTPPASKALLDLLSLYHAERDRTFGNGRLARNIFEKIVEKQANRIAGITPLTDSVLCTIEKADIPGQDDIME